MAQAAKKGVSPAVLYAAFLIVGLIIGAVIGAYALAPKPPAPAAPAAPEYTFYYVSHGGPADPW